MLGLEEKISHVLEENYHFQNGKNHLFSGHYDCTDR